MQLTVADRRFLVALARYGVMSWQQACRWFYKGKENLTSIRVNALIEVGYVVKSPYEWAGTVLWCTRAGGAVAADLAAVIPLERPPKGAPTERLLHRLAVVDVGLNFEASGITVLAEREIRACEQGTRIDAAVVAATLGITTQPVFDIKGRRRWFAVPDLMKDTMHLPDLVLVRDGRMRAVEVEVTVKEPSRAINILRGYAAHRVFDKVIYFATGDVQVNLQGYLGEHRDWQPGWLHKAGLLSAGPPSNTPDPYVQVYPLAPTDEAVSWRLDLRQVPQDMWISKVEWRRLRAVWAEHPSAKTRSGTVPFLTWWRKVYPDLQRLGEVA